MPTCLTPFLRTSLVLLSLLSLLSTACTWAPLSQLGEKVRVLEAHEVASCTKKGSTSVSVKHEVAGINRNKETVAKELSRLARNAAPDLNGDTVVVASAIKNGHQTFNVYKCIDPTH